MMTSRIFRNGLILAILALALILIVLLVLIATGNPALTGFASKNSKDNQGKQNISPSNNTIPDDDNGGAFSIIIGPPEDNQSYNYTNLSLYITQQQRRGANHGRQNGGGGGTGGGNFNPGNSNNTFNNQTNNNSSNNNNGQGQISFKRKLLMSQLKNNVRIRINGLNVNNGDEFEGEVRLNLDNKYDEAISAFNINFTEDTDISDIIADSDNESGKAFMHSTSGLLENIDLYVPKKEGDIAIIVCSGASNYDEIYDGCPNEELLYVNNSRIEISSDGLYYIVHNITGTGATGVNVTEINSTRQNPTPPGSLEAFAGNITEIIMPGGSGVTQSWAGYYGNVTGTIQLADSSDNVLYNWSLISPEGEIFASTNNSIVWNHVQCFNFTASGSYSNEAGNGGTTNLYGTNITLLETQYGIKAGDLDGVDETFYLKGTNTHNLFYVNANQFDEGECYNTRIYDSSGTGNDNNFEEVLMYEPTTYSVIFAALLKENVLGFDNNPHDFEMLVLENGHETDTETTTYYFYAAIS